MRIRFTEEQQVFIGHMLVHYHAWLMEQIMKASKYKYIDDVRFANALARQVIVNDISNRLGVPVIWS